VIRVLQGRVVVSVGLSYVFFKIVIEQLLVGNVPWIGTDNRREDESGNC
jgi:hypothetical protein